ncbi:MAG: hypothetical protein OHK0021_04710 [Bryobacter sp.]
MIARSWVLLFAFAALLSGQTKVDEGILLVAEVKRVMAAHLAGAPNYTCLQTVERYQQAPGSPTPNLVDVLRLEVAYIAGKELFAWPGSSTFEDEEFREIVSSGAFGTGDFVLHARSVFLADGTRFEYRGREEFAGRPAHRFWFHKPLFSSGYQITNFERSLRMEVAYHGEFWVDAASKDLLRLWIEAEDIPVVLRVSSATDRLDYGLVELGGRTALLPKESELRLTDAEGTVNINRTRLTRCKLFQGESNILFEDPAQAENASTAAPERLWLPAGLEVELALEADLVHGQQAVGDEITARLRSDLRNGKEVLYPKGSVAKGRIVHLMRHENPTCLTVALRFTELSSGNRFSSLNLRHRRTEPNGLPDFSRNNLRGGAMYIEYPEPPALGFVWCKPGVRLGRGFVTIWETQNLHDPL